MNSPAKRVQMSLGARSYPIHIGVGALQKLPKWLNQRSSKRAFIISDKKLTDAREALRCILLNSGWEVHEFPVPAGEHFKDFASIYPMYEHLLKAKADRNSLIIALGGGSIGDAAGFIAATYLRGVSWVGIPTTLLAQVDSCVGGKTGINHPAGKNLIGAFHQPELVVCDISLLKTLNRREIISGLGEIIKYGIIFDSKFYQDLQNNRMGLIALDPSVLTRSIQKSLQLKCQVVLRDELDRKGIREVLNFGHTFGHALESATGYEIYQHGEAVLWGMRFELALSQVRKKISSKTRLPIDTFLAGFSLPAIPKALKPSKLFDHMKHDKKMKDGRIRFVLSQGIGKTILDHQVQEADLIQAYDLLELNQKKG